MKKRKTGFYWDFIINLDEKEAKKLPEYYNLDERVLRLQTFIYDRPETPAETTTSEPVEKKEQKPESSANKEAE